MTHSFSTKFRKVLALVLIILLIACLAGCRRNDHGESTGDSQEPAPSESTGATTEAPTEATTEAPTTATTEAPTEAPTQPTETEPVQDSVMGTITSNTLNIREGAGSKYDSVGTYKKGERVEILETKGVWGRTDKGWISLNYVKLDNDTGETEDKDNTTSDEVVSDGNTTAKGYGVVNLGSLNVRTGPGTKYDDIGNVSSGERYAYYQKDGNWVRINKGWVSVSYFYIEGTTGEGAGTGMVVDADLNVRSGPGKDYERVGGLKKGDTVKILAQVNSWGYTGKGWISMSYVKMDNAVTTGVTGNGTVTGSELNIRKEASMDGEIVGSYVKGDKVEILEVKDGWGRTDKGWISLKYVKMDTSTGTVTADSLNIRKEPSTDADKIGYYEKGDTVKILERKGDWGRTDKGWINMKYVKMDG